MPKEAAVAARLAVVAAGGDKPLAGLLNVKLDNGAGKVPSILLTPVPVTRDNKRRAERPASADVAPQGRG